MDILIKGERIELPKTGEFYIDIRIYETGEIVIDGDQDKTAKAIELPPHGDLIDRQEAVKHFTNLAEIYDLALKDCDLEKEVYPHYEALMRGKKAVMELAEKLLAECPTVLEAST